MRAESRITPSGLYTFQDECLNLLNGTLEVSKAVSYLVDDQSKPFCYKTHHLHPSMHRQYLETFYKLDPLYPTQFSDQNDVVVKMNDLVTTHERFNHPYYTDFISPWGVRDIIELFLRIDDRLVAGFALFTSKDQPEFRSADLKKACQLQHFMQFALEQIMESPQQSNFEAFCSQYQLTPKECMVLELALEGLPNKTIAVDLDCGLATIKTHLQNIFGKLGVNSKREISSLYLRHR